MTANHDGRGPVVFCGLRLAHPVVNGSGTFDAIAARRVFGESVLEHFPFAAFVTKTVTLEPRQGNPPPRLWELAGGLPAELSLDGMRTDEVSLGDDDVVLVLTGPERVARALVRTGLGSLDGTVSSPRLLTQMFSWRRGPRPAAATI